MTKKFILIIIPLVLLLISACSNRQMGAEPLTFPADMDQPFLTLRSIIGEEVRSSNSFLGGLILKLKGPQSLLVLSRPTALAVYSENTLFVLDADAGRIVKLEYHEGQLENVRTFGENIVLAPGGIEIWNDYIYVSDSQTGRIHKFDLALKHLGYLEVPEVHHPGQLKANVATDVLLVVDARAHQILAINPEGEVVGQIQNNRKGRQILNAPLAIDITPDGQLVVLDGLTRRVEFFSPEYKYLSGFGGYDRVPGSFSNPRGLAISSDGFIFVSDAAFGNIQIFDTRGSLLYFFGESGTQAGQFLVPAALYFDHQDNLYIVDQFNNRVQVFKYTAQGS